MTPAQIAVKVRRAWRDRYGPVPSGLCGKVNGKLFDVLVKRGYRPVWHSVTLADGNHCFVECDGWKLDAACDAIGSTSVVID